MAVEALLQPDGIAVTGVSNIEASLDIAGMSTVVDTEEN